MRIINTVLVTAFLVLSGCTGQPPAEHHGPQRKRPDAHDKSGCLDLGHLQSRDLQFYGGVHFRIIGKNREQIAFGVHRRSSPGYFASLPEYIVISELME